MGALVAAVLLTQVQVREEPKDWKLVVTDHFDVYYPADELLDRARQFGGWFEEARGMLSAKTGVEPRRVSVFLYRSFHDLLQSSYLAGSFRPQPLSVRVRQSTPHQENPRCRFCRPNARSRALALAEPLRDRIFIHCQASDRWNAWFARHELTHHVQFEHLFDFRMPSWLVALKEPLVPWWFWEGGADYFAGIFEPHKDEFMRDLAEERLYDLKDLFFPDVLNPYDFLAVYYEGSYFWRFMDEKYGKARRLFEAEDEGLPIPSQRAIKKSVGKSRKDVEREFAEHLKEKWAPLMEGRTVPTDRLTDVRHYYRRRAWGGRWSPDGQRLAWVGNEDVYPELYVDGHGVFGWRRGIDVGYAVSPPSWSPDSKRIAVIEWGTNRDNIVLVGVEGGLETFKPDFDEIYDPAWSPDGGRIAFSALKNGTSDLYVLHLADRRIERLTNDADGDSAPAWSPDGQLAFIKEVGGRNELHILGKGRVSNTLALLEYPQWSPDGKSIVVAADVGGVYDAFAVDPATGKARRLTKFRGGVSYPSYHPDGSLVITYYEGRGQDLYRVRPEPQDEPGFDEEGRKGWYRQFEKPAPRGDPEEKERKWAVNWLMFPVTSASFVTPGVEFEFGDLDGENTLFVFGSGYTSRSYLAGATVANTRYRPTIGATSWAARVGSLKEIHLEPFVDVPLWPFAEAGVGWVGRYREQEETGRDPDFTDSGPSVSFRFSNQDSYQLRDPAWGFAFGGTATFFRDHLGGDRDLAEYLGFFEASHDIVQDVILWGRVTYEKKVGRGPFLESELLDIENGVRGAEDLEGLERGVASVEVRFPLFRDFLFKPLELIGLGEWLVFKDLRGFAFGQAGYVGTEFQQYKDDDFGAASAGVGLRLDFSFMLWPIVNLRVPTRLEVWWAIVGQDEDPARGAVGAGVTIGF